MAQWLDHWTFDQEVLGSNPVGVESFSAIPYFSSLRLSCRKMGAKPFSEKTFSGTSVLIQGVECGLHKADHA